MKMKIDIGERWEKGPLNSEVKVLTIVKGNAYILDIPGWEEYETASGSKGYEHKEYGEMGGIEALQAFIKVERWENDEIPFRFYLSPVKPEKKRKWKRLKVEKA